MNEGVEETERMAEKSEPAARRRRRLVLPVAVLLGVVLVIWGARRWDYARSHESTDDAFVSGHLVPVLAKVGGYVATVEVDENQHVGAGETLVVLDDVELRQRLEQADAELAAAQAEAGGAAGVGQAEARVEQARRQRSALDARIDAARVAAERADRDLERVSGLAAKEIVSQQQLDAARSAAADARASLRSLVEQRRAADAGVATAEAGVKQAQARLAAARAGAANARLQAGYARIAAPVAGVVAKRSVEPGQLLQAGQPLLTIVADSDVTVTANFKETQLAGIRAGEAAEVEVDAYPGCTVRGEVESISGATGSQFALIPPENATGNFTKVVQRVPVRIRVTRGCGDARPLRPGMSVVAHVHTG